MPTLITGVGRLLGDALTWILYLAPLAAGLMIGYHALAKMMSDGDPGVIADRNRKIKNVLIALAITMGSAGFVTFILTYFR